MKGLQYTKEDLMNIIPGAQNIENTPTVEEIDFTEECIEEDVQFNFNDKCQEEDLLENNEFTLRKICIKAINNISKYYRDDVYTIYQCLIDECFSSNEWKIQ